MKETDTSTDPVHPGLESVVQQVQNGNTEAYALVIQRFQKPVYVYCSYLLGSHEEAEDAVQDIFIRAYQHIGRYINSVSFSAWLYKIAYHHCLNLIKTRKHRYNLLQQYRRQQDTPAPYEYSELIRELLDKLNLEEKNILLLRAVEEYSFDEISSILELKPATVRKKYERLRKKLNQRQSIKGGEASEWIFKPAGRS